MLDILNIDVDKLIHITTILDKNSIKYSFYYEKYFFGIVEYFSPNYYYFNISKVILEDNEHIILSITSFEIWKDNIEEMNLGNVISYLDSIRPNIDNNPFYNAAFNFQYDNIDVIKKYFSILRKDKIEKLLNNE